VAYKGIDLEVVIGSAVKESASSHTLKRKTTFFRNTLGGDVGSHNGKLQPINFACCKKIVCQQREGLCHNACIPSADVKQMVANFESIIVAYGLKVPYAPEQALVQVTNQESPKIVGPEAMLMKFSLESGLGKEIEGEVVTSGCKVAESHVEGIQVSLSDSA
jgi:hypothetical protein